MLDDATTSLTLSRDPIAEDSLTPTEDLLTFGEINEGLNSSTSATPLSIPESQPLTVADPDPSPSRILATNPPPESGEKWGIVGNAPSINLSRKQLRAIEFAIRGYPDKEIAYALSIDRKTLWNWKTFNQEYRNALNEARASLHDAVTDNLRNATISAAHVLDTLLEHASEQTRLQAAKILLTFFAATKPPVPPPQLGLK